MILALHIRLVLDLSAFARVFVSGYILILLNKKIRKLSEMGSGFIHTPICTQLFLAVELCALLDRSFIYWIYPPNNIYDNNFLLLQTYEETFEMFPFFSHFIIPCLESA